MTIPIIARAATKASVLNPVTSITSNQTDTKKRELMLC